MLKVNLESCFKISVVSRNTFPFLRKRDTPTPHPISHESNNVGVVYTFVMCVLKQDFTLQYFHDFTLEQQLIMMGVMYTFVVAESEFSNKAVLCIASMIWVELWISGGRR